MMRKTILILVLTLTLKLKFVYNHKLDLNPNYKVRFDNLKFDPNFHSTLKSNEKL
jgi:hypothetical protein